LIILKSFQISGWEYEKNNIMKNLITNGNVALFEYPEVDDPEFKFDREGVLFVFGYTLVCLDTNIGVAKRFKLGLINYKVIGDWDSCKQNISKEMKDMILKEGINTSNCVIMIKNDRK
jgi:hypothetical protein